MRAPTQEPPLHVPEPAEAPTRLQVKCIGRDGQTEEYLVVPVRLHSTIRQLLHEVRERVLHVSPHELQQLTLAGCGRFHEGDMVQDVLREGDLIVAKSVAIPESRGDYNSRDKGGAAPPAPPAPSSAAARTVAHKANWFATSSPNSTGGCQSVESPWGRDLQSKKQQHWPPLLLAAYSGDAATVREILDQGDCDVNATAVGGGQKTALYYAVQFNNIEVIQLLLEHPDIDPHKEMKTGGGNVTTPLQAALEMGSQFPAYRAFLAKGWITEDDEAGAAEHQLQPTPLKDWNQAEAAPMPEPIKVEDDEEETEWNSRSDESWWTDGALRVVSNGSSTARPSRSRTPPLNHGHSQHRVHATSPARAPWRPPRLRVAEVVEAAPAVHTSPSSAYEDSFPTTMSGAMCDY